jgi:hypothetical protein
MRVRNGVVHGDEAVSRTRANEIVSGALQFIAQIRAAGTDQHVDFVVPLLVESTRLFYSPSERDRLGAPS